MYNARASNDYITISYGNGVPIPLGTPVLFQWLIVRFLAFAAGVRKLYGKGGADGNVIVTLDDGTTAKLAAR